MHSSDDEGVDGFGHSPESRSDHSRVEAVAGEERGAAPRGGGGSGSSSVEERAWSRLLEERRADGYRDGLAAAAHDSAALLQSSFNDGFAHCFPICLRLAKLRGRLVAAAAAAAEREPPAATGGPTPDGGGCCAADPLSSAADRVATLEAAIRTEATRPADGSWHPGGAWQRYSSELDELTRLVEQLLHERAAAAVTATADCDRTVAD